MNSFFENLFLSVYGSLMAPSFSFQLDPQSDKRH